MKATKQALRVEARRAKRRASRTAAKKECPGGGYCEGTGRWCGYHGADACECAADCSECWGLR